MQHIVFTGEVEVLAERGPPQAGDDRQLFGVAVEPLADLRQFDAVGAMLVVEPSGAETQFYSPTGHLIDLGDRNGQHGRMPEGGRGDQSAQADPRGLAGQTGQRDPGIGRPRKTGNPAHLQIVIGPEERIEPRILGHLRNPQQIIVGCPLLGLGEDS